MTRLLASPIVRAILATLLIVLVAGVTLHFFRKSLSAAGEVRWESAKGEALSNSAADAIGTVGAAQEIEQAIDQITRENEDAIRNATGAAVAVDPAVAGAARAGLCQRAAYLCHADCLQRLAPAALERRRAGCTAARR